MKRLIPKLAEKPKQCVTDNLLSKTHRRLHEFLTESFWDDTTPPTPREKGSVILWADEGQFKAKLLDRDAGLSVLVAAPSFASLLDACEAALGDPGAGWKADAHSTSKQRRKGG